VSLKMIADHSFSEAIRFAQTVYGMHDAQRGGVIRVRDWNAFRRAARGLRNVDHLIIYLHAAPGEFIINGHHKSFGMLPEFLTSVPRIDTVSLEGCNAGGNPQALGRLGLLFQARRIHAFNYWHVVNTSRAMIPQGADRQAVRQAVASIANLRPFLARSQADGSDLQGGADFLDGRPGNYHLFYEWFRINNSAALPPAGMMGGRPRGYFRRQDATQQTLANSDALPGTSNAPTYQFRRVTINYPVRQATAP